MAPKWKRPASVPVPTVWRRFTGPKAMPDGQKPNFWIQDVTPDLDEQIVDFMSDSFLKEEIFCSSTGVREDPQALEEIRGIWREMTQQRASLVALTDWPDGPDHPRIAGCNIMCVTLPGEHLSEMQSPILNKVLEGLHFIEAKVDVFEKYGVDKFLNALGLSVSPTFRGQDVGRELLLARSDIGRALGLKLTVTVFTGTASQKLSARTGFEVLAEQRYDEYCENGVPIFPGAYCDVFQLKAKRLD